MNVKKNSLARAALTWVALLLCGSVPVVASAASPLLAWRDPIYIAAGFAGVIALALLFVQPILIGGYMPGTTPARTRRLHRWVGATLVVSIIIHVAGLWITSPPDVIDALLFASPTPFSDWGVVAMWALFATAVLAAFRRRLRLQPRTWRSCHSLLAVLIVITSVVHSMLIEGTMEIWSKAALCLLVLAATAKVMLDLRVWATKRTPRT